MGGDPQPRNAEQDRDGDRRVRVAVERNPRRDRRDYESDASDADEHAEGADQGVFGEVLDQVCLSAGPACGSPFSSLARIPTPIPCNVSHAL